MEPSELDPILVLYAVPGERKPVLRGILGAGGIPDRPEAEDPLGYGAGFQVGPLRVKLAAVGLLASRLPLAWPARDPCRAVLHVGVAGGLDPSIPLGEALVAERLADALGPVPLNHPGPLRGPVERLGLKRAFLWTSPALVRTPDDKAALRRRTGADLVDMESTLVVREAERRGVPIEVVRAVVDGADDELPLDFTRMVRGPLDDRVDKLKLAAALARNPGALAGLNRLRRNSELSGASIESVVKNVISRLASSPDPSGQLAPGRESCPSTG